MKKDTRNKKQNKSKQLNQWLVHGWYIFITMFISNVCYNSVSVLECLYICNLYK